MGEQLVTIDRIPDWTREGHEELTRVFVLGADLWWTNEAIILRIAPSPGLAIVEAHEALPRILGGFRGEACGMSAYRAGVVTMNGEIYDSRYVALVVNLYAGATWTAPPGERVWRDRLGAKAWLGGHLVAVLAPRSRDRSEDGR